MERLGLRERKLHVVTGARTLRYPDFSPALIHTACGLLSKGEMAHSRMKYPSQRGSLRIWLYYDHRSGWSLATYRPSARRLLLQHDARNGPRCQRGAGPGARAVRSGGVDAVSVCWNRRASYRRDSYRQPLSNARHRWRTCVAGSVVITTTMNITAAEPSIRQKLYLTTTFSAERSIRPKVNRLLQPQF